MRCASPSRPICAAPRRATVATGSIPPLLRGDAAAPEREETPQTIASLHLSAAAWFESAALADAAIGHWLAAGEVETAVALVEREIQPAFDREDWPMVTRWLALLPEETIQNHLPLLLAQGWVAHLRGRSSRFMEIVRMIEERLARGNLPEPREGSLARKWI